MRRALGVWSRSADVGTATSDLHGAASLSAEVPLIVPALASLGLATQTSQTLYKATLLQS